MKFEDNFESKLLDQFLRADGLICREERQYALFLYNALLRAKGEKNPAAAARLLGEEVLSNLLGLEVISDAGADAETESGNEVEFDTDVNASSSSSSSTSASTSSSTKVDIRDVQIEQVYYEATLMRDFYETLSWEDRAQFNKALLDFAMQHIVSRLDFDARFDGITNLVNGKCYSLGSKNGSAILKAVKETLLDGGKAPVEGAFDVEKAQIASRLQFAQYMMNVTPDLIVVYSIGKTEEETKGEARKRYVRAIECKYLSGEGTYQDVFGSKRKMQIFMQRSIMEFLFGQEERTGDGMGDGTDDRTDEYEDPVIGRNAENWKKVYGEKLAFVYGRNDKKTKTNLSNRGVVLARFVKGEANKTSYRQVDISLPKLLQAMYGDTLV